MEAHDIQGTLDQLPEMEFRQLAPFNRGHVGVFWCTAGTSPWERHPEDEELLQVIEGEVDIEAHRRRARRHARRRGLVLRRAPGVVAPPPRPGEAEGAVPHARSERDVDRRRPACRRERR